VYKRQLYLGNDLVKHYDIAGVYPYGIIGRVRITVSPTILIDKIVFYVDEDEDYSSYSEFTVAKIGVVNDDISFVIPFSGIDVAKRCLFQLDMNVLDGNSDDSFDVFIDDMFVYRYIDDSPINDSETWHMHSIDLFPFIMPSSGIHTVRINATGEQWCGQPTYGQVAVDTIELYNVNVTVHQGIRRLIYRGFAVDTLPLCCDPPVLCDSVDIGKQVSEAGHNLQEWGPIEPDTHGGHYGGIDDCRVTWQSADSFRWATVDLFCDVEKHSLTIGLVGNGTTYPESGTYSYIDGTVVDLEAIPDLGWSFDRWEGDVADPNSAITNITMDNDEDVTAYFTEDQYTLDINVDGNGTVIKNPEKPYYFYNESVNLTAVPGVGWSFDHWSGDLDGSENPTTIFMNSSKEVTATFIEEWYTLNITIIGNGTVIKNPDQETYVYGTPVNLTAVADTYWEFKEWSGDLNGSENPETIIITANTEVITTFIQQGWLATLIFSGSTTLDNSTDTVVFGEKHDASDGVDIYDVPKPDAPPLPYVYAWFATNLPDPYGILWEEYRYYPAGEQVWDLWGETDGAEETTVVTITWDIDDIAKSGYDYVGLYDMLTGNCVVDMKYVDNYVYIADNGMAYHFQIRCTDNHAPVANDDPDYKTMESFELKVPELLGVLVNDEDEYGDILTAVLEADVSNGTLTLNIDGSFDYMPDLGFFGIDIFTYKAYDGELYSNIATATINVTKLNRIQIEDGWNLFSIPVGEDIDKTKIIVEYDGARHMWDEAISDHIILGFTYGWEVGMYRNYDVIVPGEGYWMWAFEDCDLLIPSNAPTNNHITYLDVGWNLVGVHEEDLDKTQICVQYDGQWLAWSEAVDNGVIIDFVYGWNRANQNYTLSDIFASGYGYWVYAYHCCALKEPL